MLTNHGRVVAGAPVVSSVMLNNVQLYPSAVTFAIFVLKRLTLIWFIILISKFYYQNYKFNVFYNKKSLYNKFKLRLKLIINII